MLPGSRNNPLVVEHRGLRHQRQPAQTRLFRTAQPPPVAPAPGYMLLVRPSSRVPAAWLDLAP